MPEQFHEEDPSQINTVLDAPIEQRGVIFKRMGLHFAVGATAVGAFLAPGGIGQPDSAHAVVSGDVSEFTNGIASPVIKGSDRILLTNVDGAGELAQKVRYLYLDKCIDSQSQQQFTTSVQQLQSKNNDNKRYLQIKQLGESSDWRTQLKAAKLAEQKTNYTIQYNRCTRPAWMPYVRVRVPNDNADEKLKKDRVKSGCSKFDINWYNDKVWVLNPAYQDTSGTTIFKFSWLGFEGSLNIPVCSRVDLKNTSASAYGGYTRTFVPHPLPVQYRTTEKQ